MNNAEIFAAMCNAVCELAKANEELYNLAVQLSPDIPERLKIELPDYEKFL